MSKLDRQNGGKIRETRTRRGPRGRTSKVTLRWDALHCHRMEEMTDPEILDLLRVSSEEVG